jgi:hypothetical protein
MSFTDKVAFWRKKEEYSPGALPGDRLDLPASDQSYPSIPTFTPPSMPEPHHQIQRPAPQNRELELVEAKLDAIKSTLDSVNQRLENIERLAKE